FFQAEDGIRDRNVTGVQTCALPIFTRIDEAESHPTADRRRDAAIIELEPSVVDLSLIDLDSAFILTHERLLGVELLLGDRILLIENVIAFEVDLGGLKLCLIFRYCAFGLRQLHLNRPLIA